VIRKFDYSFIHFRIYTFAAVTPLISIIMPVKNASSFLDECIDSIVAQNNIHWELIAVNDNSTDNTLDKLIFFSNTEKRITVLNNSGNGIIDALRTGYEASSGELITRMDADDIMPPNKLEDLKKLLIESGKGFVATGLVKYFSAKTLGDGYLKYEKWLNGLCLNKANFSEIYKECSIPSPCWMLWKSDFDKCAGFNSNTYPEDYDLAFRMYKNKIKVVGSNNILHYWRDSENRASRTDTNYQDNSFLTLKVNHFLDIDFNPDKNLILWGAGKKGKKIAQLLLNSQIQFKWLCNSPSKIGHNIYNVIMEDCQSVNLNDSQVIVAVANEDEQIEILNHILKFKNLNYFYFC